MIRNSSVSRLSGQPFSRHPRLCFAFSTPQLETIMPGLLPHLDPDGLLEYSVVYADRALNHSPPAFKG